MMQNLGNRRSVQKCAQKAGSNVLIFVTAIVNTNTGIWAAFKIVAARLAARGAFKIVACFLHNGNSKVFLRKIFASFDFPCLKN